MVTGAPTAVAIVPAIAQRSSLSVIRPLSGYVPFRVFPECYGEITAQVTLFAPTNSARRLLDRHDEAAERHGGLNAAEGRVPWIDVRSAAARRERHARDTPSPLPKESRWTP